MAWLLKILGLGIIGLSAFIAVNSGLDKVFNQDGAIFLMIGIGLAIIGYLGEVRDSIDRAVEAFEKVKEKV